MRILYIINGNGLSPHLGGSLVRSANVARELGAAGHEIHVLTTIGGMRACKQLGLDVRYHVVRCSFFRQQERGIWDRLISYGISTAASILRIWSLPQADIAYSDSDYPCDVIPALLFRRFGRCKAWVAMIHHFLSESGEKVGPLHGILERSKRMLQDWNHGLVASHADRIFVYATEAGFSVSESFGRRRVAPERIVEVHNGFDGAALSRIQPARDSYEAIVLGGLRSGKGLSEIVPIWREAVRHVSTAKLLIIGPMLAENEAYLQGQIEAAHLSENITIAGGLPHDEAVSWLKSSQMLLAVSLEEGWGIAVCEALAIALPVVAYDLPTYRGLFPAGIMRVPIGNRPAFSESVVQLLQDPARRQTLASDGPKSVAKYEWRNVAQFDSAEFGKLVRE